MSVRWQKSMCLACAGLARVLGLAKLLLWGLACQPKNLIFLHRQSFCMFANGLNIVRAAF